MPASSIQWVPVISPLPFSAWKPAQTGIISLSAPRGIMAVTPVATRGGPSRSSVEKPTVRPGMSVIAFSGPGVPGNGKPISRPRGFRFVIQGSLIACVARMVGGDDDGFNTPRSSSIAIARIILSVCKQKFLGGPALLLYITLGAKDLTSAGKFYDPVMATLGQVRLSSEGGIGYGPAGGEPTFWLVTPFNKIPASWGNGTMIALSAPNRAAVDKFHAAGVASGGLDEGGPGIRGGADSNFYSCYVRDPDGNKLSAVFNKPV